MADRVSVTGLVQHLRDIHKEDIYVEGCRRPMQAPRTPFPGTLQAHFARLWSHATFDGSADSHRVTHDDPITVKDMLGDVDPKEALTAEQAAREHSAARAWRRVSSALAPFSGWRDRLPACVSALVDRSDVPQAGAGRLQDDVGRG